MLGMFLLFWALGRRRPPDRRRSARSRARRACSRATTFWRHRYRDRRHAAAVRRRHRQVGADPALRLAARRDGRPDAGLAR